MDVPFSAEKDDLYYPAKHAVFFPSNRPKSDVALCVEMARLAYCRQDVSFAFDQDRIRKILGRIQFTDCKFFESTTESHGGGSHGLLALDEENKLAVLAFRGTDKDDPTDLTDDFNALPEKWQGEGCVHAGFANALLAIWPEIDPELQALAGFGLLFTGHSLGAAMATLAASLRLPKCLYTFGSPRVGDQGFVDGLVKKQIDNRRYVDCCDLVTRVPPDKVMGYAHLGKPFYIDFHRALQKDPGDAYIEKDRAVAETDYLERYAWRIGDVAVRALADHAPINYVWPVTLATQ